MSKRSTFIYKALSGALLLVLCLQVARLLGEKDPLADLPASWPEPVAEASQETGAAKAETPPENPDLKPLPALPEKYKLIESSGIFGLLPRNPWKPTLLGIAGRYAILLASDGRSDLVSEGGELGGMKVLRIATNRVLIEYQGKEQELTLFSGLGSSPLIPKGKESSP